MNLAEKLRAVKLDLLKAVYCEYKEESVKEAIRKIEKLEEEIKDKEVEC